MRHVKFVLVLSAIAGFYALDHQEHQRTREQLDHTRQRLDELTAAVAAKAVAPVDAPAISVPPIGAVPRELDKITLAPSTIESPCVACGGSGTRADPGTLYDKNIRTVYVPLFNNRAYQTTPYRGFEVDVTQAVIRQISKTSPFRVTSDWKSADTELLGNIVSIAKRKCDPNQSNQAREAEMDVTVDVVWRDLRDGTVLSRPRAVPVWGASSPARVAQNPKVDALPPFDPNAPVPPDEKKRDQPMPLRIVATGRMIPERGETTATAEQKVQQSIAVQIVTLMETRW